MSTKTQRKQSGSEATFRIGAVSRLTGVPTDTLRVWERRYGVVEPQRSDGGSRLYSQQDVARLGLIKRLVNSGYGISTVANLELSQLESQANSTGLPVPTRGARAETLNTVVVGTTLAVRLQASFVAGEGNLNLVGAFESPEELENAEVGLNVDVLILERATLNRDDIADLQRLRKSCEAGRLIVVYGYGETATLGLLKHMGVTVLRFPVTWDDLHRLWQSESEPVKTENPATQTLDFHNARSATIPQRQLSDQQIAKISTASAAVKCECPHHMAELLVTVTQFERYSEQCKNRNQQDADVHAYLHATTANVRATLETALLKLIEIEGIDISPAGSSTETA